MLIVIYFPENIHFLSIHYINEDSEGKVLVLNLWYMVKLVNTEWKQVVADRHELHT